MEEDVQNPAQVVLPPVGQRQNGSALERTSGMVWDLTEIA
jgi:hypothetical protein